MSLARGIFVTGDVCHDRRMPSVRQLLATPVRRSTWRRYAYFAIGAALVAAYGTLSGFVIPALQGGIGARGALWVAIALCAVVLPIATGMLPAVRELEIGAARRLLAVDVPAPQTLDAKPSWATRWRSAAFFVAHLLTGGVIGALSLVIPPAVVSAVFAPFATGDVQLGRLDATVAGGPGNAWIVPLALLSPIALVYVASAAGAAMRRAAPRMLGPSAAERLAASERHALRLAQRNRLARELHDSVGHALSIVTVQAGAAGRVLDDDPAFVREALANIETSARSGLRDLDHALGLLREDAAARAPTPTLADLQRLVDSTRSAGIDVTTDLEGKLDEVPHAVSREAYRIVQESLTNVLRHAGRVPVTLSLSVRAEQLEVEVTNPLDERHPRDGGGGGRGLDGMRERVITLRGDVSAGADEGRWRVVVRLPLHPVP